MANEQHALAGAMRSYESSRARAALMMTLPAVILAVVACGCGTKVVTAATVGVALVLAAWFFRWRGRALGRSVAPGLVAGLAPFALAVGARAYGHVCTGGQCVSLCIPACTLGGALAGFFVARTARRQSSPLIFLLGASALATLVGSLGCSCVGFGGVGGLAAGLAVTSLPQWIAAARRAGR